MSPYAARLPHPKPDNVTAPSTLQASHLLLQQLVDGLLKDRNLVIPVYNAWKKHGKSAPAVDFNKDQDFEKITTFGKLEPDWLVNWP